MALAIDAISVGYQNAVSDTILTWSHTCSGKNRLLVVHIAEVRNTIIVSVTYAGVDMILATSVTNGNTRAYIYYLVAPALGANNVVITYGTTITSRYAGASSYTGAAQIRVLGATNTKTGTAQDKSINITTQRDGSVITEALGALWGNHYPTAGQAPVIQGSERASCYKIVGTVGVYTQTWSSNSSAQYSYAVAEFVPPIGPFPTHFRL